ncbi:flavin reductase family protein [Gordonia soli]|uniref:Putative oxidoreductase n=1 Tax=Gordonia soli NBRC 108243 TaxID=1223545 RepID=M0QFV9_9ACTN|nr:flavin reductase family protein [Gordonia soli]GAC67196.1 putative oxidoreductase [Gordonia soli NBRC 108243]
MTTDDLVDTRHPIDATDAVGIAGSFREALSHFCSGVVVITAEDADGEPTGMTVGSFTSISLDPPLVGFFAGSSSTTLPRVLATGRFSVNVLAEGQDLLARSFARSGTDKFAGVSWTRSANGAPRLDGAHAWIDCDIDDHRVIGDHELVVGRVSALIVPAPTDPLVFHRSMFRTLGPLS